VFEVAATVLGEIRKAKTAAKRSLRTDVERVVVRETPARAAALEAAADDVREAGRVQRLDIEAAEDADGSVEVTLAPEAGDGAA
jgi:valyl-tRNA synthetase